MIFLFSKQEEKMIEYFEKKNILEEKFLKKQEDETILKILINICYLNLKNFREFFSNTKFFTEKIFAEFHQNVEKNESLTNFFLDFFALCGAIPLKENPFLLKIEQNLFDPIFQVFLCIFLFTYFFFFLHIFFFTKNFLFTYFFFFFSHIFFLKSKSS